MRMLGDHEGDAVKCLALSQLGEELRKFQPPPCGSRHHGPGSHQSGPALRMGPELHGSKQVGP